MDKEALLAAAKGDVSTLKKRLDRGINIDAQDAAGCMLLHQAASNGQSEVVECLLEYGADVLLTTHKNNNTALHIAATKSSHLVGAILGSVARDKLRRLLDARTKATGNTAIHVAAKLDLDICLGVLLLFGANVEIRNHAGELPVDLATDEGLRELLRLLGANFALAKVGQAESLRFLELSAWRKSHEVGPLINCRNGDGRTLLQVLVANGHADLARRLLRVRDKQQVNAPLGNQLFEPTFRLVVEALLAGARQCRQFWSEQKAAVTGLLASLDKTEASSRARRVVEIGCDGLRKSHEVLLAHQQFEGGEMPVTLDVRMKSLEEAIEALGFDPEELYEKDRYYKELPPKWKEDVRSFMLIMERVIYESIDLYMRILSSAQMFHAVKDDDLGRVQQLLDSKAPLEVADHTGRTVLCIAVEIGNKKMVKLLLKSGAKIFQESALSPITLAVEKGHAKIVKLLLKKASSKDLPKNIDWLPEDNCTYAALHAAARGGHLDMVKILLKFGATYEIRDVGGRKPLDVSTNEEVMEFLTLVESCFHDAKEANIELVYKLKAMPTDDFLSVAATRNRHGQTLVDVATKAEAKKIAGLISRMTREAKSQEQ